MGGPGGGVVWSFVLNITLVFICFCWGGEGPAFICLFWYGNPKQKISPFEALTEKSAALTHTLYPPWPSREEAKSASSGTWATFSRVITEAPVTLNSSPHPHLQSPRAKMDIGKPTVLQPVIFSIGNARFLGEGLRRDWLGACERRDPLGPLEELP